VEYFEYSAVCMCNYHLVLKVKVEVSLWDIEIRYFQSRMIVQHNKKQQNCCLHLKLSFIWWYI